MNTIDKNHIVYSLLIDPKYRMWRYLLLCLVGSIETFNMVFIAYQDCGHLLGSRIYWICISSLMMYAIALLFNHYYLLPRFLLKGRYAAYSISLALIVFSLPTLSIVEEYWIRSAFDLPHRITSYTSPLILIDNLASCLMIAICFLGISVVELLHQWMNRRELIDRMEQEHLQSEVNKLKGQITPGFLSKTLNHAAAIVKSNPGKATKMLIQLGKLLRYQLYDCNRNKVLLPSEINFLADFLFIEQMNKEGFTYEIETKGILSHVFVSPLLFISFVQDMVEGSDSLHLLFSFDNRTLYFQCLSGSNKELSNKAISRIRKRLDLQYGNAYTLDLEAGMVKLNIDIPE